MRVNEINIHYAKTLIQGFEDASKGLKLAFSVSEALSAFRERLQN